VRGLRADFVFTAGEQHFYHDKNFKNEPKRCKGCKAKRQVDLGLASPRAKRTLRARSAGARPPCFQAHAGTPGILPRVLPKPQDCTGCGGRGLELRELAIRSATAGSHDDGGVRAALPGARSVEHQGSRTGYNQIEGDYWMRMILCAAALMGAAALVSSAASIPQTALPATTLRLGPRRLHRPCFANGEIEMNGREAVFAWKIAGGSWGGVNLAGLAVWEWSCEHTLGNPYEPLNPAVRC